MDQEKEQKELEKAARVEASLREREKEVQRTLAVHLRDRDNEREQHKHDEAVQHFNALLADLVSEIIHFPLNTSMSKLWPVGQKYGLQCVFDLAWYYEFYAFYNCGLVIKVEL